MVKTIHIAINGEVGSGKSAVLRAIAELLANSGYCVAIPDRAERNNPSRPLQTAAEHERPRPDETVFILTERVFAMHQERST